MGLTDRASLSHKVSMKEMTHALNSNKAFLLKQRFLSIHITKNSTRGKRTIKIKRKLSGSNLNITL
jgi:hypothetical protein